MLSLRILACSVLLLSLNGCGERTTTLEGLREREITLPGGQKIEAEVMMTAIEMQRGMMFRDSLPRGHGMLFIHTKPGNYAYWMYQVKIPLDIIWMDSSRRIVEISANTPPCKARASECPKYGGQEIAQYVLELGGGEAQRLHLTKGGVMSF